MTTTVNRHLENKAQMDPQIVRFIQALAIADARRDHRAAMAECGGGPTRGETGGAGKGGR